MLATNHLCIEFPEDPGNTPGLCQAGPGADHASTQLVRYTHAKTFLSLTPVLLTHSPKDFVLQRSCQPTTVRPTRVPGQPPQEAKPCLPTHYVCPHQAALSPAAGLEQGAPWLEMQPCLRAPSSHHRAVELAWDLTLQGGSGTCRSQICGPSHWHSAVGTVLYIVCPRESSLVPGLEGPGSWWQFLPLYLDLKFPATSFPSIPSLPWPWTPADLDLTVGSVHACMCMCEIVISISRMKTVRLRWD